VSSCVIVLAELGKRRDGDVDILLERGMRGHRRLGLGRAEPSSLGEYRMAVCVDVALQTVPGFRALHTQGRRQTMGHGGRAHGGACIPWFEVSGRAGVVERRMDFLWESCKFFHGGVFKTLETPARWKFD
jgi:hypothetical protein